MQTAITKQFTAALLAVALLAGAVHALAQSQNPLDEIDLDGLRQRIEAALTEQTDMGHPYSPYVGQNFPRTVYWGDLHVHTHLSADAYSLGNRELDHAAAYRYAKGQAVRTSTGQMARLSRPLDFLLISDHASYLGVVKAEVDKALQTAPETVPQLVADVLQNFVEGISDHRPLTQDPAFLKTIWQDIAETADRHNEPGIFTAFIGYEWTSQPGGNNLHRNVLFMDGAAKAGQITPFSALDSRNPEDLWRFFARYEADTGGRVLSIPHNGNLSNGLMFSDRSFDGDPLTAAYAEMRLRWEPIIEATQEKGDGEAHPALSPDDPFADFETWDQANIMRSIPKEPWMLRHEYARSALKLGLELDAAMGGNPFKFGLTGSSDAHIALATAEENNFFGKFATDEPRAGRAAPSDLPFPARLLAASGYTGIWATENTREALFAALQRKEVYATTGPRITLRFFGGWNFADDDHQQPDLAATGYAQGVPMGGDLPAPPTADAAPRFLVAAQKDALGANLDRLQIVKGWLDEGGKAQEKVHDIALSDGRTLGWLSGQAPALPSTVDPATATYTNSVGAPQLTAVWQDPDFNPAQPAFYYVRVLQIRTPRWTAIDAAFYQTPPQPDLKAELQDRAYSSPIWYTP